jgi:hypothetical protein
MVKNVKVIKVIGKKCKGQLSNGQKCIGKKCKW